MKVKLEMEFEDIQELKTFLDSKVKAPTCQCQTLTPTVPEMTTHGAVTVEPVEATVTYAEVQQTPPPQAATAEQPAEPVTTTTPQAPTAEVAPTPAVSTAAPSYTLDDLARAGSELVDLGKQTELPGLLQKFGITSLPELPQEKYGEFAMAMRELGARI